MNKGVIRVISLGSYLTAIVTATLKFVGVGTYSWYLPLGFAVAPLVFGLTLVIIGFMFLGIAEWIEGNE